MLDSYLERFFDFINKSYTDQFRNSILSVSLILLMLSILLLVIIILSIIIIIIDIL